MDDLFTYDLRLLSFHVKLRAKLVAELNNNNNDNNLNAPVNIPIFRMFVTLIESGSRDFYLNSNLFVARTHI